MMNKNVSVLFSVLCVFFGATLFSAPAHATRFFTSDRSKDCDEGFGCISGNAPPSQTRSQGVNFPVGVYGFEELSVTLAGNLSFMRNRNVTSRRSMVVRLRQGYCFALRYDDRFWVQLPGGSGTRRQAISMALTNLSRPPGSTTNVGGCSSTRWI